MVLNLLFIGYFAQKVTFEENIVSFFPETEGAQITEYVFDNLKVKDKIIVFLSSTDSIKAIDSETIIEAADKLKHNLENRLGGTLIKDVFSEVNKDAIKSATTLIYNNLPLFLSDSDYTRLDSLLTPEAIQQQMAKNYSSLISPLGLGLKDVILRDPLGIGSHALSLLESFNINSNYEIANNHIFSDDGLNLLMFVSPVYGLGQTGENEKLVEVIEEEIRKTTQSYSNLNVQYFGGPSVSVYNAKQIKQDTTVTSIVATVIIVILISLAFKRKRSIFLILAPVLYGMLFSLCLIYFIKGGISLIAIGAGSAIIGIALSYSIHMLAHQNHVSNIEQLLRELAAPLTIGSFTTIGAFLGLLFTSSPILRDFGLFSSLALIGTTLFCLIFLPQFLKGQSHIKKGGLLTFIEKINNYPFEKNKWLIILVCVVTIVCFFTSQRVKINEDMMSINYWPKHIQEAEKRLSSIFEQEKQVVLFVSTGKNYDETVLQYKKTNDILAELKEENIIEDYASVDKFFLKTETQSHKIDQWNRFWSEERKSEVQKLLANASKVYGFKANAFNPFYDLLDRKFEGLEGHYLEQENSLLQDWFSTSEEMTMLITQVRLNKDDKTVTYEHFKDQPNLVIFDRGYLANHWVLAINDNFNLILFISSLLVFFTLWLSYGRIELALMSFLPMFLTWIIILGIMGIFGIEFNIINIILSTFIFGIGDDFSIFIMDGLLKKYSVKERILSHHKTAIFISALTIIIGMGVLILAKHPAIQSISVISILGIISVVLVSYILQPVIFNLLIAKPTSKGLPPYTLFGLLRTLLMFSLFLLGCLVIRVYILLLQIIPVNKKKKQASVCFLLSKSCRFLLTIAVFAKKNLINETNEDFKDPAVVIANHQSFIDILQLVALSPKILLVTNEWVWNSPFFGSIIRYAGFICINNGYEDSLEYLNGKVKQGYSIAIFPEGTRSPDGRIKRFHKGAFYFAQQLKLDIIPILLYGNKQIISKKQPFNIRKGELYCKIYPRRKQRDISKVTYQELSKELTQFYRTEYLQVEQRKRKARNPYYYENLVQNYIYKGPITEWYIRVKVKMENYYEAFDQLIPKQGKITDIGCGLGPLSYMLSMLSPEREILGIDYDKEKITIAQNGWLRSNNLNFVCANAIEYDLPVSDVFILSDMLHYMSIADQTKLIKKCVDKLHSNGSIIIRDGNKEKGKKHKVTQFTEILSTRIFKFNKTTGDLVFSSESEINALAKQNNLSVKIIPNDKYTSNTIYLLQK